MVIRMVDNHSSSKELDRRSVLKKLGAGAAVSSFSMAGMASAQRSIPESDVEITGMTGVSPDAGDVQAIAEREETSLLSQQIKDETGLELDTEFAVGINLETDDDELNSHDPRVMHLPLKPSGAGDTPSIQPRESTSEPEFSIDNGGTILAITIQEDGERTIAGLMGMTRQKSQVGSSSTDSNATVDTKSFVVEDGSAKVHRESTGEQPLKADWQSEIGGSTTTVTPADTNFTCWGCATVVGIACAGAATLSYSSCVSAAFASSVFSPTAGAAVAAFCTYIVSNAGTLSCAAGTAAICAGVTNDCSFLED